MSEKLYLPVSILLSSLIIAGAVFMVGADIGNKVSGLTIAAPSGGTGNTGTTTGSNPTGGTIQTNPTPPAAAVDMEALLEDSHVIYGDPVTAKVKIVEFSDFECPFCGSAAPTVKAITEKYGEDVSVSYAHFPLSFHPSARPAALASECAAEQGKFPQYHDKLFANQQSLSTASLKQYAVDLGLNAEQFNGCLDSQKYGSEVDADFALGSQSGVSGTPTFFINGQKLVGAQPQANFEAVIDGLLS